MYPRLLLSLFVLIAFQSCQKELSVDSSGSTPPAGTVTIDSNYLSKIYYMEAVGGTDDTLEIFTYNYDASKRVVSIVDSSRDTYSATQQSSYYSYHNSDTLPYRTILYQVSAYDQALTQFDYDTTTTYHYFDNSGRNTKDSVLRSTNSFSSGYSISAYVRTYTYGSNAIYGNTIYSAGGQPDRKDTALLDANGNILEDKIYKKDFFSGLFVLDADSKFTYDNKTSPFARLSNLKTYGVFPSGETLFMELEQRNNRVTQNELNSISPGGTGTVFAFDFANSYLTNGFIKEAYVTDHPLIPGFHSKVNFVYKAL